MHFIHFERGMGELKGNQLACESGYILHFAAISEKEMVEASIDSFVCDYKKMEVLFTKMMAVGGWRS